MLPWLVSVDGGNKMKSLDAHSKCFMTIHVDTFCIQWRVGRFATNLGEFVSAFHVRKRLLLYDGSTTNR